MNGNILGSLLSVCFSLGMALQSMPLPAEANEPAQFDTYVLAMSYEKQFCATHPAKPECQDGNARDGMALHGLWPNRLDDPRHLYQYCSPVDAGEIGSDWCAPSIDVRSQIGPQVMEWLQDVMPGVQSCLYNHEWYAHGTCSGSPPSLYFGEAATLAERFLTLLRFQGIIARSQGGTASLQEILDALEIDLGPQASRSAVILCETDPATLQSYFAEVDLSLNRASFMLFPSAASLGPSTPAMGPDGQLRQDVGNCPAEGIRIQ